MYRENAASYTRYSAGYIPETQSNAALDEEIDNIFSAISLAAAWDFQREMLVQVSRVSTPTARGMCRNRIQEALTAAAGEAAALEGSNSCRRNALLHGRVAMRRERSTMQRTSGPKGWPWLKNWAMPG